MRFSPFKFLAAAIFVAGVASVAALAQNAQYRDIGRAPTPEEMQVINKGSGPSGKDLPPGKGTAQEGEQIFMGRCSMCHGADGAGLTPGPGSISFLRGPRVTGGTGTPRFYEPGAKMPVVSFATFVAFPTSIFNSIAISMPMFHPGTLTPDQVYALTAFVLAGNGIIKKDDVMDRETLPKVVMPDRNNFIPDNVQDIPNIEKRGCFKTYGICP
jgi:cytochrome c